MFRADFCLGPWDAGALVVILIVVGCLMSAPISPDVTVENRVTVIALGPACQNIDETVLDNGLRDSMLEITKDLNPPLVVVDMSHTKFFGSSFIEILFRIWNRLHSKTGGQFAISGLNPYCAEVLKITHLDTLWRVFPTREDAVRTLNATGA